MKFDILALFGNVLGPLLISSLIAYKTIGVARRYDPAAYHEPGVNAANKVFWFPALIAFAV